MAKFKNEKGLTLIELLITISVLAVVSAIALPVINNVVASSNSNAAVQTQSDVTDFITKYNAAGETLYAAGVFSGYVDADGDNTIDANELVDTLTIDTGKFSVSVAGTSDTVGGSYTNGGVTGATVALATGGGPAPVVEGYVADLSAYTFSASVAFMGGSTSATWSASAPVLITFPSSSQYTFVSLSGAQAIISDAAMFGAMSYNPDNTALYYGGQMELRYLSAEPTTGSGAQILPLN